MARAPTDIEAGRLMLVEAACALIEERGHGLGFTELAARTGMSTAQISRYFENREALTEAVAEYWFRPKVAIMEQVIASDLPPRRKMYEFFAQRFVKNLESFRADPVAHQTYIDLGEEHFEQVRSYIDLGDHYLGTIIGEAMDEGAFAGLEIDELISLVNQMVMPYCNPALLGMMADRLNVAKLARIIDAVFDGLSAQDRGAQGVSGLRAA